MREICCSRLAPIRFAPFSYFCTCWNVSPNASPSFSWLMPRYDAPHAHAAADVAINRIWCFFDLFCGNSLVAHFPHPFR